MSFIGRGRVDFDSLRSTGKIEAVGGINNPARNKPLKLADDLIIVGKMSLQGRDAEISAPGKNPIEINDDLDVAGAFTPRTIATLSAALQPMVTSTVATATANFVQSSTLANYATVASLSSYATTDSLSSCATAASLAGYATTGALSGVTNDVATNAIVLLALYDYNRCVLNLSQLSVTPAVSDMLFCWDNWLGTPLSATTTPEILSHPSRDDATKLKQENTYKLDR